jgi:hypothetical protein
LWRFLAALHGSVAGQILQLQRILREQGERRAAAQQKYRFPIS